MSFYLSSSSIKPPSAKSLTANLFVSKLTIPPAKASGHRKSSSNPPDKLVVYQ